MTLRPQRREDRGQCGKFRRVAGPGEPVEPRQGQDEGSPVTGGSGNTGPRARVATQLRSGRLTEPAGVDLCHFGSGATTRAPVSAGLETGAGVGLGSVWSLGAAGCYAVFGRSREVRWAGSAAVGEEV